MTANTNFNEFKKLFFKIPKERYSNVWFIGLINNSKIPVSGSWLKPQAHLEYYQIKDHMKKGGNIAVVALPMGLMFVDVDVNDDGLLLDSELLSELLEINTFTVKTRSGGLHFYFLNDGYWATQNHIQGELRANSSYVTAVGSWVDGAYVVVNDQPIKSFEGNISKFFKRSETINDIRKEPTFLHGKKGKPLSDRLKERVANRRPLNKNEHDKYKLKRLLETERQRYKNDIV